MRTSVAMAAAARSQRDGARQSVQQLLQYTVLDKARALSLFLFLAFSFIFEFVDPVVLFITTTVWAAASTSHL
jgi:hypothetical protein